MKRRVSSGIFWNAKVMVVSGVLACWGDGEAVAQALTPPSTEPDFFIVEEFLEAQGVPRLALPEDGPTQQQRNRQERAWEERVLGSVLRKRVAGQPIEAEANVFLDQWLSYRYGGVRDAEQTEGMIRNARALIDQRRLDDAYFYYCFTEIVKEELDNRRQRANLLSQSLLDYPQQGYPPILAVWISSRLLLIPSYDREKAQPAVIKRPALARTAVDSFVHAITGGEVYQPDESWLMVQHFRRLFGGFPGDLVHLTEAIWSLPSMEPWMVELFQGLAELRLAWKSRGSEWASRVTEKGMEGWLLHLEKAYGHLLASWQANPDDPSAAAEMINVVVGGYSRDGDTARRWFDRSVSAQADYYRAYDIMWWAYRPRWGTSREKRLAFGLACWLSQRFDTTIPMELETALEDIVYVRREKWREALYQEPVVIALRDLGWKSLEAAPWKDVRGESLRRLAMFQWLIADYSGAEKTLELVGAAPNRYLRDALRPYSLSEAQFRGEVQLGAMDQFDRYLDGRLWYWEGDLGQARQIFEAMLKLFPETCPASRLLESDLALIDMEERLGTGESVALGFDPEMMLWDIRSGDWTVSDAGELEFQFGDQTGFFRLISRVRLGKNFEMSGEFVFDKLKRSHLEFGPMVGCHRNRDGEQWISCLCEREFWGQWYFDLLDRTFASNFDGKRRGLKVKEGNVFSFRLVVKDGKISYWMNDLQIVDNHEPGFYHQEGTSDIDIRDNDPTGIFLASRWSSARATVRNLTVRKLSD